VADRAAELAARIRARERGATRRRRRGRRRATNAFVSRDVAVVGRTRRAGLEGDPAGIDDHAALDAVRGAGLCVRRATERRRIAHALLPTPAELEAANRIFVCAIVVAD